MKLKLNARTKAVIASYARSFAAASLSLYLAGNRSPSDLVAAGFAAILPVVMRWLNTNDSAFGRSSSDDK